MSCRWTSDESSDESSSELRELQMELHVKQWWGSNELQVGQQRSRAAVGALVEQRWAQVELQVEQRWSSSELELQVELNVAGAAMEQR